MEVTKYFLFGYVVSFNETKSLKTPYAYKSITVKKKKKSADTEHFQLHVC